MNKSTPQQSFIISASLIQETDKAYLLDCDGDKHWFPKSEVTFNSSKNELSAPQWLLDKIFPDEDWSS